MAPVSPTTPQGRSHHLLIEAFATETVWALATRPGAAAAARLRARKGRAETQPFQLLCASAPLAERALALPPLERERFLALRGLWPGPLTLIGTAAPGVFAAPDGSVGLRVPGWPPARRHVAARGGMMLATSLNRSGEPSVTTYAGALHSRLADRVYPGPRARTGASTVVDLRSGAVLREGHLSGEVRRRLGTG